MKILKVLVVEDDEFKRKGIHEFLSAHDCIELIRTASSVASATHEIDLGGVDLVVLDMAIPNFDDGAGEPQGMGGLAVFRYLSLVDSSVPVIVMTQFEALGEGSSVVDISTLDLLLDGEFKGQYIGIIKYDFDVGSWKARMSDMLREIST